MTTTELVNAAPPDKRGLMAEADRWSAYVRALTITDRSSCEQASFLLRSIKNVRADIQKWFAPHVERAMESKRQAEAARKGLVDEQQRMEQPLIDAEAQVKRLLLAFEQEQERHRVAEEARLQAEAQTRAEAETLAAAAALEAEAVAIGDVEMLAEAESLIAQPVDTPAVYVPSAMPKVQGITYRDNWKAHPSIDVQALAGAVARGEAPVSFLLPNTTAINQWARATKGGASIAGIRVINDRQIAARG